MSGSRLVVLFLCGAMAACSAEAGPTGPTGAEGPAGPPGPGTAPSISAVSPLNVYLEHLDTVVISGSGTAWDANTVVDFGAGVSVQSLTVASPTAILAHVLADSSAALGPRSIVVRSAADTTRFEDAFQIEAPLELTLRGSWIPGGQLQALVYQRNAERPFQLPGHLAGASAYLPEAGVHGFGGFPEDRTLELNLRIPLNVPAIPTSLAVVSGTDQTVSRSEPIDMPELVTVPTPLGTSVQGTISEPYGTVVHEYRTRAGVAVGFTVAGVSAYPVGPDSMTVAAGGWAFYARQEATWFVSLYAPNSAAGASYTFTVDTTTVTPVPLSQTPATGSLSGLHGTDFYSVELAVGEVLTVTLTDGPTDSCTGTIDAAVTVRSPSDEAVWVESGGCPGFSTFPAAVAGTYSVDVIAWPDCECTFDYSIAATIDP